MEEHFILRVPQSVAERLERILNENPASESDEFLDLAFQGRHLLRFLEHPSSFCMRTISPSCHLNLEYSIMEGLL